MSGIYLTVWGSNELLNPTSGGWPHITLAWTGKNLQLEELKETAKLALDEWAMRRVKISHARVNKFYKESEGKYRYDVLLILDRESAERVQKTRQRLIKDVYTDRCNEFGMGEPHITTYICWTLEDANEKLAKIQHLLPATVTVEGVTI